MDCANSDDTTVATNARATTTPRSVGRSVGLRDFEKTCTKSVRWIHRGRVRPRRRAAEEAPIPEARRIPEATVARLPLYYRALLETADLDIGTVSSQRLAELAGV